MTVLRSVGAGSRSRGRAEDALHTADVEQVEAKGARAGGVDARGPIADGEAQQLLRLAQAGPGEHAAEEPADELLYRGADLSGLAGTRLGIPQGVGGQGRRIVGVVRRPAPGRLGRVDLDQRAAVIDAHEAGVGPDLHALMQVARRHRVQGAVELDVVIAMDGGPGPRRPIEGCRRQREQRRLLDRLEHDARHLAGGAMHARAGQVPAPEDRAALNVGDVEEGLPAEEVLAGIGDCGRSGWGLGRPAVVRRGSSADRCGETR